MKSIRKTLYFCLGMLVVFFAAQLAIAWWAKQSIGNEVIQGTHKNTSAIIVLNELVTTAQRLKSHEKDFFIYADNSNIKKRKDFVREWGITADKVQDILKTIKTNHDGNFSEDELKQAGAWIEAASYYIDQMKKIIDMVDSGQQASRNNGNLRLYTPAEASRLATVAEEKFSTLLISSVLEMSENKSNDVLSLAEMAQKRFDHFLLTTLINSALGIALAVFLLVVLLKLIMSSIQSLSQQMEELSRGKTEEKTVSTTTVIEFDILAKAVERVSITQQMLLSRLYKLQPKEK